eukprot:518828_1
MPETTINVIDLSQDVWILCCSYLDVGDVFRFSNVCKFFSDVGQNPNSITGLRITDRIQKYQMQPRFSKIKSLIWSRSETGIPLLPTSTLTVWAKHLQQLTILGDPCDLWSSRVWWPQGKILFQSLKMINLEYMDPNVILSKIRHIDKLKLQRLDLASFTFDEHTLQSILMCRNVEHLR